MGIGSTPAAIIDTAIAIAQDGYSAATTSPCIKFVIVYIVNFVTGFDNQLASLFVYKHKSSLVRFERNAEKSDAI